MTNRTICFEAEDTTRERILKAAMLRFSVHSYENTVFRDLASDVGVDMAYVHRSFGSKEKLFYEAVKEAVQFGRILSGDRGVLPSNLTAELLVERGSNQVRTLDIIVRSFASADASRVLKQVVRDDLVGPLLEKCPDLGEQRAALVGAFLAGFGILRDVIGYEALQEKQGGELEGLVSAVFTWLLDDKSLDNGSIRCTSTEQGKSP